MPRYLHDDEERRDVRITLRLTPEETAMLDSLVTTAKGLLGLSGEHLTRSALLRELLHDAHRKTENKKRRGKA